MSEDVEIMPSDRERTPAESDDEQQPQSSIAEPGKLMRIALMLRELQEEVRRAAPDAAGRDRLRVIHDRAVQGLCGVLSEDLQKELVELTLPFDDHTTPTESEILIAQAQLIGWLEGLFQGIQAALFNQQLQARQQFEQMRRRGLPQGGRADSDLNRGTGQYL
ncbi:MAG TPA: proteasome activator [Egibacteraceae bacterium]